MSQPFKPIGPVETGHLEAILILNNGHAAELSWLEPADLSMLVGRSCRARVIGPPPAGRIEAFLTAFDQDADYASPNFRWFRDRYPRFVYVDRVVVDPAARGRGHARRLYEDLFAWALAEGHEIVTCEVNAIPPNPTSEAFHEAMGFREIGEAAIHGGAKTVRYYAHTL